MRRRRSVSASKRNHNTRSGATFAGSSEDRSTYQRSAGRGRIHVEFARRPDVPVIAPRINVRMCAELVSGCAEVDELVHDVKHERAPGVAARVRITAKEGIVLEESVAQACR